MKLQMKLDNIDLSSMSMSTSSSGTSNPSTTPSDVPYNVAAYKARRKELLRLCEEEIEKDAAFLEAYRGLDRYLAGKDNKSGSLPLVQLREGNAY